MGTIERFDTTHGPSEGYLAQPPAGGAPGVVVIQEWWGLVPHITEVCDRFASDGFIALAPDLFHGVKTTEPDEASKLMMQLDFPRAIDEIAGAIGYLRAHEGSNGRVGVVGFCMGGALTLAAAAKATPDAAVPFYGHPSEDPGYANIRCPVLGHWAEHDDWATTTICQSIFDKIAANGVEATLHVYPGTSHAFFNDHRPEVYVKEAAETAYGRTIEFLRRHLV